MSARQEWVRAKDALPDEGEWVLHGYAGVRFPECGVFARGSFHRGSGPETYPTTHWMRIPRFPKKAER